MSEAMDEFGVHFEAPPTEPERVPPMRASSPMFDLRQALQDAYERGYRAALRAAGPGGRAPAPEGVTPRGTTLSGIPIGGIIAGGGWIPPGGVL